MRDTWGPWALPLGGRLLSGGVPLTAQSWGGEGRVGAPRNQLPPPLLGRYVKPSLSALQSPVVTAGVQPQLIQGIRRRDGIGEGQETTS